MSRIRVGLAFATVMILGLGTGASLYRAWAGRERTTTSRLSPDETIRARLVETSPPSKPNRDVRLDLDSLSSEATTILLRSTEEGRPEGTERLVWSKDGRWLLLVGRHFFVKDDLFLDNGDQLYFLHHLPTRRSWSNAANSDRPALKAETIRGIEFTEPILLEDVSIDVGATSRTDF